MKTLSTAEICRFRKHLLQWHENDNKRSMPWKGIKNPYFIWLSEIILQQTRVEQGLAYYERFTKRFPTLADLAQADEAVVFNLWQGLGYYSRCRNLIKAAKVILELHNGVFPSTYDDLRALPGVGDYTAAAIASFAYKAPYAAVDGNVIRILSRYMASNETPSTQAGKRFYNELAQKLVAPDAADTFNQAMMDLGATVCTPGQPHCARCPLQADCRAYKSQQTSLFPVKKKKNPLKHRHFHFGVFSNRTHIALIRRKSGDIWAGLYTPWLIEGDAQLPTWPDNRAFSGKQVQPEMIQQVLSHQKIFGYFYSFSDPGQVFLQEHELLWVPKKSLSELAFPRMVLVFLKNSDYL
jgi:A/G-specific adenine glycosylase